jgi:hypothetical protein
MYKHLTSEERHYIAIGIKQGMPKNKIAHSKAMAVFYKIVKLAKNGVLMIIHIYAKVF